MTETKLKGKGEVSLCGVNDIIASVQEMERARENVAILLNDLWHSAVIDYGFVRSKIIWNKFRFSRVKICVVVGYVPSEGDGKERDNMDRILDRVGNGYRLCILADLNGWIGDRTRAGITGTFGVPGENDNGRRVVEFCKERGQHII